MFLSNELPETAAKISLRHSISWHRDRENTLQEDPQNDWVESSSQRKFTAGKKIKIFIGV